MPCVLHPWFDAWPQALQAVVCVWGNLQVDNTWFFIRMQVTLLIWKVLQERLHNCGG